MGFLVPRASQAKMVPAATGLAVQTSVQGTCIPLIYGTTRVAGNLIWYSDFKSTAVSNGGGKGGVTGGGGGKGSNSTSYTYSASVVIALGEGPINGVNNVYANKQLTNLSNLGMSLFVGNFGQSPWGYLETNYDAATKETHTIPSSGPYTVTVNGPWLQDNGVVQTHGTTFSKVIGTPVANQYQLTGSTYTFNAANAGQAIVIQYANEFQQSITYKATIPTAGPYTVVIHDSYFNNGISVVGTAVAFTAVGGAPGSNQYSVSNGTYTFNAANAGQQVYITYGGLGGQNLGYSGIAYVAAAPFQMGSSAQLPNINYEVPGFFANSLAQEINGEQDTIPASAQITVAYAAEFTADKGVIDQDGNVWTKVGSSPGYFQYSVSAGVYTFNAAQAGTVVNISYSANAGPDADPSLVVNDILTNAHHGVGFPSARVGDLSTYQAYCIATGLVISPAYTTQQQASSMLDDIAKATNSAWVWSSGKLTLVPYGDTAITANGYTYTPPSQPLYSLTDDDFMRNTNGSGGASSSMNDDPILVTRKRQSDAYNSIKLEWLDRNHQYNPAIIEAKDQAMISLYGLRQDASRQFHMFCNGNAARLSVQLQLQREQIRNMYQFQLDQRYIVLDPMDIVAVTDTAMGIVDQWVRITEITENDDGSISVLAEEYLQGTGNAPQYSFQSGTAAFAANYNADPGSVNTPVIFEPPVALAPTSLEVWLAVSGGPNFGGCEVYVSTDGVNYANVGTITGPARMGTLSATLASHADPDTTDTLSVDLSESFGQLLSGTQAEADNYVTLCYVGGELISYEAATLTDAYQYGLTYLRRGAYNTTISSHAQGTQFARLDSGIFQYTYNAGNVGQKLYIKLCAYNLYGGGLQSLSDVTAYTYTIQGPPPPGQVQNFSAQQQGDVVVFAWDDLATEDGLKGYDIAYGAVGSSWGAKQLLTEAHRGTEMTNASVPPGTWEFSIRGHDIANNLSPLITTVQLTVTNSDDVISQATQEPLWPGTLYNFDVHWSGVLVPLSQYNAGHYVASTPPGTVNLAAGAFDPPGVPTTTTMYVKITFLGQDANGNPLGETLPSAEQSISVPAGENLAVSWTFDSTDAFVNIYVGTTPGGETLQNTVPAPVNVGYVLPGMPTTTGAAPPTQDTTGWQIFNEFVPDPVASANYTAPTVDTGYNDNLRVLSTMASVLGPGQSGSAATLQFQVDTWQTGQSDPGIYTPWTVGFINMRYLSARFGYFDIVAGNVSYITDFTPTIDNSPQIENANSLTVAPGGTAVTFPTPYHVTPNVVCTVVGSSALYASAASITTTGFTAHVWDHTGADVGGVINWQAVGQ